ncbi:MAG: hypothetical protein D6B27_00840 [Gammaproteobacteria bacterium]|nr:MAG: hypothetical protein D6B27_00840 [Gammaproteobacteria bacterium]
MEYNNLIQDFVERTKINLNAIEELKHSGNNVYEVTQFINSLLGMLIFPQQEFFKNIPQISITEAETDGWIIPNPVGSHKQVANLSVFLRYLRNAVSHCNIEVLSKNKEISGIKVWNISNNGTINWECKFSITELKSIVTKFHELIKI